MQVHPVSFDVEVIFGAPGKGCEGAGICQIIPVGPVRVHWKCPNAKANISPASNGGFSLTFNRKHLPSEIMERFFPHHVFVVEEVYTLSKVISERLKIASFSVLPGQYSAKVSEDKISIYFISS
ncbi:MAG TPA: hypothetical protein VK168_05000 [Saprospiraceae bacterium]|nr:hypothetical protein [Saprospiraceae bacterium]